MKSDMCEVREQWRILVQDRDLQLKKKDTEMALKVQNIHQEIRENVEQEQYDIQMQYAQEISKFRKERHSIEVDYKARINMIESTSIPL